MACLIQIMTWEGVRRPGAALGNLGFETIVEIMRLVELPLRLAEVTPACCLVPRRERIGGFLRWLRCVRWGGKEDPPWSKIG